MARVLFVSSAHPGGRGEIGAGEGVGEGNLRKLLAAGHEVHVLCFASDKQLPHPDVVNECASYKTIRHTPKKSLQAILSNFRQGSLLAPWFFTRVSVENVDLLKTEIAKRAISKVWVEFPSSLAFAQKISAVEIDYFAHDVVTQKISRKMVLRFLAPYVARVESNLLGSFQRCHVLSEKDAALVHKLRFKGDVNIEPPSSTKVGEVPDAQPIDEIVEKFSGSKNVVFFGNMSRPENHLSMMIFLIRSYFQIQRSCPGTRIWIIGLRPKRSMRLLGRVLKNVHVTGAVDDPTPAFKAATVCIAPMLFGAGVKIKVLQMLESGAFVIATPIGAEGVLESLSLMVVKNRDFRRALIKYLGSYDLHLNR